MLSLPPTREAFKQHVYQSHCQAAIWMSAKFPDLPDLDPANYGWTYGETNIPLPVMLPDDVTPTPVEVLHIIGCSVTGHVLQAGTVVSVRKCFIYLYLQC